MRLVRAVFLRVARRLVRKMRGESKALKTPKSFSWLIFWLRSAKLRPEGTKPAVLLGWLSQISQFEQGTWLHLRRQREAVLEMS